jgi:hypothetical protein
MTKNYLEYKTPAQAHARVNQLQAQLGLALTAEPEAFINKAWDEIERLEALVDAKPAAAQTTPVVTATKPAPKVEFTDPLAHVTKDELRGIARAAAAQREGRTAKPTPGASTAPLIGVMRAAKAQEALNARKK